MCVSTETYVRYFLIVSREMAIRKHENMIVQCCLPLVLGQLKLYDFLSYSLLSVWKTFFECLSSIASFVIMVLDFVKSSV